MMNVLAISLVLTTLVTAGFFNEKKDQDVILKEGHRVVVVEFDKEDGTKVSISPQDAEITKGKKSRSGYVEDLKDKLYEKAEEASSVLPNVGQGVSIPTVNQDQEDQKPSAKDVVCDAFGKCKERIASAIGKTKDKVSEKAQEVGEKVEEVKQGAKEKVKEQTEDVIDKAKTLKGEMEKKKEYTKGEVSEKAKELKGKVEQTKDSVKESTVKVKEEGKKDLNDILKRGHEFFSDVFAYIFFRETLRPVMRLAHFLGFAVAYGVCMWVTFISSYVLAKALPRQQFALVQSKIYPVYFKTMAYCVGAASLGHLLSQKHWLYSNSAEKIQGFNLLSSVAMLLVNLLYLEPRATKVMFERLKLEKEEGRGRDIFNLEPTSRGVDSVLDLTGAKTTSQTTTRIPAADAGNQETTADITVKSSQVVKLSQKLKKLNSYSSFLNVLTLMALSHHLVYLTQQFDASS